MESQRISMNNIVRNFSPAWYASVMGTGGVANVLYEWSVHIPVLKWMGVGMWWLNIFLFLLFLGPWAARWVLHMDKLREDLKHPVMSNFFVTMPVGGIILGINFFTMGKAYFSSSMILTLGTAFWIYGVLTALLFGVFVTYNMMMTESIGPELTNFSWYITPVASIVIPLLGNLLIGAYAARDPQVALLIHVIDICFFGIGIILFFIFSSILISRFISYKMPLPMAAPTFWIILGPIGVGTLGLMGIAETSEHLKLIASADSFKILALMLWGFGIWAFFLTVMVTLKYLKNGGIPFSLSWWGFIFPLAAYALSGFSIYQYTKMPWIEWYTGLLALLLVVVWLMTLIRSLLGVFSGKLLVPPTQQQQHSLMK